MKKLLIPSLLLLACTNAPNVTIEDYKVERRSLELQRDSLHKLIFEADFSHDIPTVDENGEYTEETVRRRADSVAKLIKPAKLEYLRVINNLKSVEHKIDSLSKLR